LIDEFADGGVSFLIVATIRVAAGVDVCVGMAIWMLKPFDGDAARAGLVKSVHVLKTTRNLNRGFIGAPLN
jgi:hypothetical protein